MKIGFIQFNVQFGDKDQNLKTVERLMQQRDGDLWVLPELFNTGYLFASRDELQQLAEEVPHGKTTEALISLAQKSNSHIVAGLAEQEQGKFYNTAVYVNPHGFVGKYRKIHLFFEEKFLFQPGDLPFPVFDTGDGRIGLMLCFDWVFPEAARTLALKGADILCHPSNLVLPYCQKAMKTRCLENHVFAVTCNRIGTEQRAGKKLTFTGGSQIVTIRGSVFTRAGAKKEAVGVMDIDPLRARHKYITEHNHLLDDRRPEMYELGP